MKRLVCSLVVLLTSIAPVAMAGELWVHDAWVRATPPGARTAAAYMRIDNTGETDRLLEVRSNVSREVQIHTHVHEDGMMSMKQIESLEVPGSGKAVLRPHGDHLMLIGLEKSLADGDLVVFELRFEHGGWMEVALTVKDDR